MFELTNQVLTKVEKSAPPSNKTNEGHTMNIRTAYLVKTAYRYFQEEKTFPWWVSSGLWDNFQDPTELEALFKKGWSARQVMYYEHLDPTKKPNYGMNEEEVNIYALNNTTCGCGNPGCEDGCADADDGVLIIRDAEAMEEVLKGLETDEGSIEYE